MPSEKQKERFTAGVDIGSRMTKSVIVNNRNQTLGDALIDTDIIPSRSGRMALELALSAAKLEWSQLSGIAATGYGRVQADFASVIITEISCHAKGVHALDNSVRTIIDIGGQDSKVIKIDKTGRIMDFVMNDRCAAGTGKFLEVMARALGADINEFGNLRFKSQNPCAISSMCTVFAESEVISLLAVGTPRENIIAGLHKAVANRVANMAMRLEVQERVGFTGGVAKNAGMARALEEELKTTFCHFKYNPQLIGALGAAIHARDKQKQEVL